MNMNPTMTTCWVSTYQPTSNNVFKLLMTNQLRVIKNGQCTAMENRNMYGVFPHIIIEVLNG